MKIAIIISLICNRSQELFDGILDQFGFAHNTHEYNNRSVHVKIVFNFAKSKMVSFPGMSRYCAYKFSTITTGGKMSKNIDNQLASVDKVLDMLVSVLFEFPIMGFFCQKFDELCKYIRSIGHFALMLCFKEYTKSNEDIGFIAISYYM